MRFLGGEGEEAEVSTGNYKGRSGNFFRHSLAYWMLAKAQTYTFMIEKREKKFAWKRFKEAVRHHKWMNTPVIGKLKMPRETKKAVQKLSETLITQEQIEQAVRMMHAAMGKPPDEAYVLIWPPEVVALAKQKPEFEPLKSYVREIEKPYSGEVGRLPVCGRPCRIVQAMGANVGYAMRDEILDGIYYPRGGEIR